MKATWKIFTLLFLLDFVSSTACLADAPSAKLIVDPSTMTDTSMVVTNKAEISLVSSTSGKALRVKIVAGDGYPGISFPPANHSLDLSAYNAVDASITNSGQSDAIVGMRVDNAGDWHNQPCSAANIDVPVGATTTLRVIFGKSYGHVGYAFDSSKVTNVLLFVQAPSNPISLDVNSIKAIEDPGLPRYVPQTSSASTFSTGANMAPINQPLPSFHNAPSLADSKRKRLKPRFTKDGVLIPDAIVNQGYSLVKNWDFRKTVTNLDQLHAEFFTRYIYNNGTLNTLGNEWERYADNDNHVFNKDGLDLTARVARGLQNGGIDSGMLRSKWIGEYGYYEARVKVPRGRGMWPAFWLNPNDEKWPPEIDVFEIVDNGRDTTRNSFHELHPGDNNGMALKVDYSILDQWYSYHPDFDFADDYHTFAVLWTPDSVTHFVDGIELSSREMQWTHANGDDGGPADVLINLAVGGTWPGDPQNVNDFPAALKVQYIRVWQNPTISPAITALATH